MSKQASYRSSHTSSGHGDMYDQALYSDGKYDANVWKIEQEKIGEIIDKYYPSGIRRYLDYAAGAGRIISSVAPYADNAIGIDISSEMIAAGRNKYPHLGFVQGDITTDEKLLEEGSFDCITCFRFFLNAEEKLRNDVLEALLKGLSHDGYLICNNHGNSMSLLHPVLVVRRLLKLPVQKSLAYSKFARLLEEKGLAIVEVRGVCYLPRILFNLLPNGLWNWMERTLGLLISSGKFAIYQIIVAKKD